MGFQYKQVHSHYIPKGPLVHKGSGLRSVGLGHYPVDVQEISLSSSWLIHQKDNQSLQFRISCSFPEEWKSLSETVETSKLPSSFCFDFFIFRDLSVNEISQLKSIVQNDPQSRIIVAANHLMNWKSFLHHSDILAFLESGQLYVSFLPQVDILGPFLKPQEVLIELDSLGDKFPLFIPHFVGPQRPTFYHLLTKESYVENLKRNRNGFWKVIRLLDRSGFHLLLWSFESLLGFFADGRIRQLVLFVQKLLYFIFHKFWIFFRYRLFSFSLFILYPLRKIYWFSSYQIKKRIVNRGKPK